MGFIVYEASINRFNSGGRKFSDIYQKIIDEHYVGTHSDTNKKYIRAIHPKVCCFCQNSEPETSFRKESHAIPAFLGNRIFFSHEECDRCNEYFGLTCEDHLARLTEPLRILFQLPTRNSPPKGAKEGSTSQFRMGQNGLIIEIGGENNFAEVAHLEDQKKFEIKMPIRDYMPSRALRSVLRSAWLFMNLDQRQQYTFIRKIILNEQIIEPFSYFICDNPDRNPHSVALVVYEKINKAEKIPDLLVELSWANSKILWASPMTNGMQYESFPLPSIRARPESPKPTATLYKITKWEKVVKPQTASFQISYEKLENTPSQTANSLPAPKKGTQIVNFQIKSTSRTAMIENLYMKVFNAHSSAPKFSFTNRGPISFSIHPKCENNITVDFHFRPAGKNLSDVDNALKFLNILQNEKPKLEIVSLFGQMLMEFNTGNVPKFNYIEDENIVKKWTVVCQYFQLEPIFPATFKAEDLVNLNHIYNVVSENELEEAPGSLNAILSKNISESSLHKILDSPFLMTAEYDRQVVNIFNKEVIIPIHEVYLLDCKIDKVVDTGSDMKIFAKFTRAKYRIISPD